MLAVTHVRMQVHWYRFPITTLDNCHVRNVRDGSSRFHEEVADGFLRHLIVISRADLRHHKFHLFNHIPCVSDRLHVNQSLNFSCHNREGNDAGKERRLLGFPERRSIGSTMFLFSPNCVNAMQTLSVETHLVPLYGTELSELMHFENEESYKYNRTHLKSWHFLVVLAKFRKRKPVFRPPRHFSSNCAYRNQQIYMYKEKRRKERERAAYSQTIHKTF